jgi:hypothetical protein
MLNFVVGKLLGKWAGFGDLEFHHNFPRDCNGPYNPLHHPLQPCSKNLVFYSHKIIAHDFLEKNNVCKKEKALDSMLFFGWVWGRWEPGNSMGFFGAWILTMFSRVSKSINFPDGLHLPQTTPNPTCIKSHAFQFETVIHFTNYYATVSIFQTRKKKISLYILNNIKGI